MNKSNPSTVRRGVVGKASDNISIQETYYAWAYHKISVLSFFFFFLLQSRENAIARSLAIALTRKICYCQTSGNSKISVILLLPDV